MTVHSSSLLDCFGIVADTRTIALVGGGGKTSLMYALAREIRARGKKVVTTTTTKIFPPSKDESPCLLLVGDDPQLHRLHDSLVQFGHVTVGLSILPSTGKVSGLPQRFIDICQRTADWVIVEADGAAGRPIKAPEQWEPVIPSATNLVIPVVGLDCLGKPVSDTWVFRLQRFLAITGLRRGEPIGPEAIATLLSHPDGAMKGVEPSTDVVPFLNKADALTDPEALNRLLHAITQRTKRIRKLVVGTLRGEARGSMYELGIPNHEPGR